VSLINRLFGSLRKNKLEDQLNDELEFHIEMRTREFISAGMDPEEARYRARRVFGNQLLLKERTRDMDMIGWVEALFQDLRYTCRMLRQSPGFTAVALLMLAVGIGANTTIFNFVNAFYLRPLPVHDPYRLVRIYGTENGHGKESFCYPEYTYLREHSKTLEAMAAHYSTAPLSVVANGDSQEAQGAVVSANYFSMLGVRPLIGRFFLPEEDAVPDRNPVAVISFGYWRRRFAGDPQILGKKIRVNGTVFEVVGVAPEDFHGVALGYINEMWIPSMMLRAGYRWCDGFKYDCRILDMMGRLAPGRRQSDAAAELAALPGQLASAYPATNKGRSVRVLAANGAGKNSEYTDQMLLLTAVASVLLLIACANLGGLLLARGAARRREIAMRLCIGASRPRLMRQLITESLFLSLIGGGLGLAVSYWAKDLLLTFYATDNEGYTRFFDLSVDTRVLAYAIGLSLLTGVLFGLAPAIQATRQDLRSALQADGDSGSFSAARLRNLLVAGQVALSLALLVSAGLLTRSAMLVRAGANFDPHHVVLLRLRPRLVEYSPEKAQAFQHAVVQRLEALPGVESVSFAKGLGFVWTPGGEISVRRPTELPGQPGNEHLVGYHEIAPHYFETLKIPLIQGREFDERDRVGSPLVTIMNETLARHLWPEGSPLGQTVIIDNRPRQVVAIFKDAKLRSVLEPPSPFLYVPFWQNADEVDARMCIRVAGDPRTMLPVIRREIASVDANVPISEDMPMTEQVNATYMPVLLASDVVLASGALALFLTATGLYGVLAFAVSQRTREIGIRMALGAVRKDVIHLVLRQGIVLALVGVALGVVLALLVTRLLAAWLYGVAPRNVITFAGSASLLVAVALVASYIPARRASSVQPIEALRHE
jgi:predicted permease